MEHPIDLRPDPSHTAHPDGEHPNSDQSPGDDSVRSLESLESLVQEGDVVMLVTAPDGRLGGRPLTVAGLGAGTLLFLVDGTVDWVAALGPDEQANASVSTRRNDWVSVTGAVTVTNDPEAITRLWSPAAGAYFDDVSDERLRVLQLHMESGEYWSAPGSGPLGRMVALVAAVVGAESASGERGLVSP